MTKEEFKSQFNVIDPKKMVQFVDLFRKGELYVYKPGSMKIELLTKEHEEILVGMMNSNLFLFGKKQESILERFLNHYIGLVESGDCGNWDPHSEEIVVEVKNEIQRELKSMNQDNYSIEHVFEVISNAWNEEPETLIELGITDQVYQNFEKYLKTKQ